MMMKVAVIDEDFKILEELKEALLEGSQFDVTLFSSYEDAIEKLANEDFDILITELIFSNHDGVELIEFVRKTLQSQMLITVFTNVDDNYSQVAVFDSGADDYFVKPINARLLRSKLVALTRRLNYCNQSDIKEVGDILIDNDRFIVIRNDNKIELQKKEFEIVDLLASHPDKIFTREEIKKNIWGGFDGVRNRTIDVHIRKLRAKLGDDFIQTIKGVGYRI
tara:strand:- start:654 stop:1319 length:666 start_codon:yes stop_codon:yes gene_type:complete